MNLYENELYMEDVRRVAALELPWEKLIDSTMLITGATGLIGSFLVDVLMQKNADSGLNCTLFALGRNKAKADARFCRYTEDERVRFVSFDINQQLDDSYPENVDYVLHMASNTHPMQYSTDPIGTIATNIIGLRNMLEFACKHHCTRFAFTSSNEIYGENRGDVKLFDEEYCGYIDCNTLRAGYPESKRCGEALCQAYMAQKGLDVVIPRFTRSYGPTILLSDTKAISQFIRKGIAGEDIVLKSNGTQFYSYTYVSDAVSGLLNVLLKGEKGEAYNIADESSDIMLKDLAQLIAKTTGRKVVYEIPDLVEAAGYSKATVARLNGSKLKKLGWAPQYNITKGIQRTIQILETIRE